MQKYEQGPALGTCAHCGKQRAQHRHVAEVQALACSPIDIGAKKLAQMEAWGSIHAGHLSTLAEAITTAQNLREAMQSLADERWLDVDCSDNEHVAGAKEKAAQALRNA